VHDLTAARALADALADAERTLSAAGVAEPRRGARRLAAAVLGVPVGRLWLDRAAPLPLDLDARLAAAAAAHAAGVPIAYAAGTVAFRSLELGCDRRALIPRPETEGLVDLVLAAIGPERGGWAADLGAGTGCVALALAVEGPFERVVAVEGDPAAAALARENVARVRPAVPVAVREGDWLAPLGDCRYRAIVANPPYLTDDEWAALEPAVRDHEPRAALASGPDGMDATRAIVAGAAARLARGGVLALEIDERRGEMVRRLTRAAGFTRCDIHEDLFGRPRYAVARAEGATT
jgi:release factor glutamine methyltransferase